MHGSELIVRAKRQDKLYELLPLHALEGDFPQAFVEDYAHWLDTDTGIIEWRPLPDMWVSSPKNWRMRRGNPGEDLLIRGSSKLIDVRLPTAKAVSAILKPLEEATHVHTTINCETGTLDVHLPRLNLDFFLRSGAVRLESKQFRGMSIDTNQSFGAMAGLVNRLVLCNKRDSSRSVIIPYGDVRFKQGNDHVRVQITTSTRHVLYHYYHIDHQLGRLVDSGSLKSQLFKSYLHAVTAHCLTDDLTGRTGTEEALSTLASASVQSFPRLEQAEIHLLLLLARLTPSRRYYPPHVQAMQEVKWERLSPLSQHDSFATLVQSIFQQARALELFQEGPSEIPDAGICGAQHLLERAAIRNSTLRVDGFGAEAHTTEHDILYDSRDRVVSSTRASDVCRTAQLVETWSQNLGVCPRLLEQIQSWGSMVHGCYTEDELSFGFNLKLLDPPAVVLPKEWCTLQTMFSQSAEERDKYKIMMFLSTLAYSQHARQELVQTLLAFATVPGLRAIRPPNSKFFQLSDGYEPDREELFAMTKKKVWPYEASPESCLPQLPHETLTEADERRQERHCAAAEGQLSLFVHALVSQWPSASVSEPVGAHFHTYISVDAAVKDAQLYFQSRHRNAAFRSYIRRSQDILDGLTADRPIVPHYSFLLPDYSYSPRPTLIELKTLLQCSAPHLSRARLEGLDRWISRQYEFPEANERLGSLLDRLFSESQGGHEERYTFDLQRSFNLHHRTTKLELSGSFEALVLCLNNENARCKENTFALFHAIRRCLEAERSVTHGLAYTAGMWPRLSKISLLRLLVGKKAVTLHDGWKAALINFGLAICDQQRVERLLARVGNHSELLSELSNPGHEDWNPFDHPEWLLFEVENNILIRPAQAHVAKEMISPSSGANSLLQLNMGEGKSSVIVPMVAAALADGEKLVRVVVLKPLASQMFHLLRKKLGGLLGQRIFHMPVSRSVRLDVPKARQIRTLCLECMESGGLLLVQPEHLLSFELMGLERMLAGEAELGKSLVGTQRWLEARSRDVLDESDEILSVKFELVYTMGTQKAIDFSPDRWLIVQHVLGLVHRCVDAVHRQFPQGLDLEQASVERFPRMRLLDPEATSMLMKKVAREICDAGLPGLGVWTFSTYIRDMLFRFLTDPDVDAVETETLQHRVFAVDSMKKGILLLRGLIAGGVLAFALRQKRWRVDYGLDLSRTPLAVPYRAKDSPAARAEFSHPDTTIILTCCSYYYGGLSDTQLRVAFEKLLGSDHAREEYEGWVQDVTDLPSAFRQLTSINLSDSAQTSNLVFPSLRRAKSVVDFYLSHVVFPTASKEFPHKLSASGWNIAKSKNHLTTGFSGTNDSRYVLPLSIHQNDLRQLRHTNAAQLECLLRSENSCEQVRRRGVETLNAESLLSIVRDAEPPVRVILDVGAQVLEWTNEQVAGKWLASVSASTAQAAVFFDDRNDLTVRSRDGITAPLLSSPFEEQMDQCLVYLDEAHTRGTDLKLPTDYRAAVTLGPGLTKDRLLQGMTHPIDLLSRY